MTSDTGNRKPFNDIEAMNHTFLHNSVINTKTTTS